MWVVALMVTALGIDVDVDHVGLCTFRFESTYEVCTMDSNGCLRIIQSHNEAIWQDVYGRQQRTWHYGG
jgi:hypothetical protein